MKRDLAHKRQQIVAAALECYRTHGVGGTTLKVVALSTGMPLGNLYYYFNTRHDLLLAVLSHCEHELLTLFARWDGLPAETWIAAYFNWLLEAPEATPTLGCPFGALANELRALRDPAASHATRIVQKYFETLQTRLFAMEHSAAFAEELFLMVQGTYTVAQATQDAALFRRSIERLRDRTLHVEHSP